MKFEFIFLIFSIFLIPLAISQPTLYNPIPQNNTYISVGSKNFSIDIISANLNNSAVFLIIRAENVEEWEIFQMNCKNSSLEDWHCVVTVPLGIVGADTVELYYFKATDIDGITSYYGTETSPLKVTVDGKKPEIRFIFPENQSWISNITEIKVRVDDTASGVDENSVYYSINNISWIKMNKTEYFTSEFDSSQYLNNETLTIYVNASDRVGNKVLSFIEVKVDNEKPRIVVIEPEEGKIYSQTISLKIEVSDSYSGINYSTVNFSVDGISGYMNCSITCSAQLDTSLLEDGEHEIIFQVYDKASNFNSTKVKITTQNIYPSVRIDHPSSNTFTSESIFINVTIVNPGEISQYAQIRLKTSGFISDWINMEKIDQKYFYYFDISRFQDGEYEITIRLINTLNLSINSTTYLTVDREPPEIDISYPEYYVKDSFNIQIVVLDSFELNETVKFKIENYSYPMNCEKYLEGKKLVCSLTFNSSLLEDGKYKILFYARDLANNEIWEEKEIAIDNNPPSLYYLKIEPITSPNPTIFKFLVYLNESGSYVKNVSLIFHYPDGNIEIVEMENVSSWKIEKNFHQEGSYFVDLSAVDLNNNELYLEKIGHFSILTLTCGDGICQEEENYCTCPDDCEAIICGKNQVLDCGSGIPKCISVEIKEGNYCGDGICLGDENCSNCEIDCGKCLFVEGFEEEIVHAQKIKMEKINWILIALISVVAISSILILILLRKKKIMKIEKGDELEYISELIANALVSTSIEDLKNNVEKAIYYLKKLREKSEKKKHIDKITEILYSSLNLNIPEARKKIIEVSLMIKKLRE